MKALNDKLMLADILAHLRDLMKAGGMAITHSDNEKMREFVTQLNSGTAKHQFEVYEYMHAHGMYPVQYVSDKELQTTIDMHKGKGAKI